MLASLIMQLVLSLYITIFDRRTERGLQQNAKRYNILLYYKLGLFILTLNTIINVFIAVAQIWEELG